MEVLYRHIASDPAFIALRRRRNRFNWILTAVALSIFFSYILTIAFWPEWLAVPLGDDTVITRGIPIGFGVILTSLGLIGLYVVTSHRIFDPAQRAIVERALTATGTIPDEPAGTGL